MIDRPENPQLAPLADTFMTLAGNNGWSKKRQKQARRLLMKILEQAARRGAIGANVNHDRHAHDHALTIAIELTKLVDPERAREREDLPDAEAMQAEIVAMLTVVKNGKEAA